MTYTNALCAFKDSKVHRVQNMYPTYIIGILAFCFDINNLLYFFYRWIIRHPSVSASLLHINCSEMTVWIQVWIVRYVYLVKEMNKLGVCDGVCVIII